MSGFSHNTRSEQPVTESLWQGRNILAFAVLAMATSGFGQTFFIAVFGAEIRATFDLSHTHYGVLYSAATIVSALLLLRAGGWADSWHLPRLASFTVLLLALGCLLVGLAPHAAVLALGFLLIRFAGQGLIAHLGITTAGRHFRAKRGKAVAITAAGLPLAEAILPATAAILLAFFGWRAPWLVATVLLVLVVWPVIARLAATIKPPGQLGDHGTGSNAREDVPTPSPDFTRGEALRDPGLYMLLPAVLATPFIVTAILFHQTAIAEARAWPLEWVATAFIGFAGGHFLALLAAGPLVDRIGAQRALPLMLAPMACGLLVLAIVTALWSPFLYLALIGITTGGIATAGGALWAERYGSRHLGAIRAVAQAVMVVSTAIAPVALGLLLDGAYSVSAIAAALGGATLAAAALATAVAPPRRAHAGLSPEAAPRGEDDS